MIIKEKILNSELEKIFIESPYADMVKLVVDIEKGILSAGGEYHMECAEELTEKENSHQKNLWGANLYKDKRIDFISLINIKPAEKNRSMEIQDDEIKKKVEEIIRKILWT